jgi:hypothetical protein
MGMFKFWRNENDMDTSLFDPEHDMDLVTMINEARTDSEMRSVAQISRARMRARRKQLAVERRRHQVDSPQRRGSGPSSSLMRGF